MAKKTTGSRSLNLLAAVTAVFCASQTLGVDQHITTYNIAGLPEPLSSTRPITHTPEIADRVRLLPLILVQENFWYDGLLRPNMSQPFQSSPSRTQPTWLDLGDGLDRFSMSEFSPVIRVPWKSCHGFLGGANDCLTSKGFSFAQHQFDTNLESVHVYNLHLDAGGSHKDQETRRQQLNQLLSHLKLHSLGAPVIIAGDFNLSASRPTDMETFLWFLDRARLTSACLQLNCGEDVIDKVLFRGNRKVSVTALSWDHSETYVSSTTGRQLSDHRPVSVHLRIEGR